MPRVSKSKSKTSKKVGLKSIDRKPIRPLERQKMRPWLIGLLDNDSCHQLGWFNKKDMTFKVSWKHAAGQTFDPNSDATLFELWARHTGKYYTGDRPDPKKWKANFRCALHSLQDVDEDKSLGVKRGNNAYRVYRFLDEKKAKKVHQKIKEEKSSDYDSDDEDYKAVRNTGTRSRPRKHLNDTLDSEGSDAYSPSYESNSNSDWDMCSEHETEGELSPLPNFEEICKPSAKDFPVKETKSRVNEYNVFIEDQGVVYRVDNSNQNQSQENFPIQFEYESENSQDNYYNLNLTIVDSNFDVQEEIVSSDGPNVVVVEYSNSYTYEFTSLEDL
ncbi:interferon regulatory factor 1 [Mactra antiquata]